MRPLFQLVWLWLKLLFYVVQGPAFVSSISEFGRQASAGWSALRGLTVLNIVIIRCSKYDGETGFLVRDWRGVMPSNSLATLYGLVRDLEDKYRLGANVRIITRIYDESVQIVRPRRIAWLTKLFGARTLVMLAGVQTNQLPRARDLALAFRQQGLPVAIGGFHVTGVLSQFPQNGDPVNGQAFRELGLQELVDHGVILFAGEAEGRLQRLLEDCLAGTPLPIYNYVFLPPNLLSEPLPRTIPGMNRLFARQHLGTIDACRGCPRQCKFCCIWKIQGRKMRPRGVQPFIDFLRLNWQRGIWEYFFTADNSVWDPFWRERFEAMIALRTEGVKVSFLMQVDTQAHTRPGFLDLAAQAGCTMVFIGIESLNPANLEAVDKDQNRPVDYPSMIKAYRSRGIGIYFAMMIGLPHDTRESVAQDVQTVIELGPDLVSFSIVMPCPGADDHAQMFRAGQWMEPGLNWYDMSSRRVTKHPLMSQEEWLAAYRDAWQTFYSPANLIRILKRTAPERYWEMFNKIVWMLYALTVTRRHPLFSGFIRLRDRGSRRRTWPQLNRFQFWRYNLRAHLSQSQRTIRLVLDLVEIWLQTRPRSEREQRLMARLAIRSRGRENLIGLKLALRTTRSDIALHWHALRQQLRQGKVWALLRWKTIQALAAEFVVTLSFLRTLLVAWQARRRP